MRTRQLSAAVLSLLAVLALSRAAGAQDTCVFQSHAVAPPNPVPFQPFTVSVNVLAACVAFHPAVVTPGLITVDVECACPIDPSPPPMLWSHTFEVTGLPAGPATVSFRHYSQPEVLYYTFALFVGSAFDIPTLSFVGSAILAAFLAVVAMASFRRSKHESACRLTPRSSGRATRAAQLDIR